MDALSKSQIDDFFRNGFVVLRGLYTGDEVAHIERNVDEVFLEAQSVAIARITDEDISVNTSNRIEMRSIRESQTASILAVHNLNRTVSIKLISWVGAIKPILLNYGRMPKITVPIAQLLGSKTADHLINQVHFKKSGDNVKFDWHQDIENRRSIDPDWTDINGTGSFVQAITAIDEASKSNGGLVVLPHSHLEDLHLERAKNGKEKERTLRSRYNIDKQELSLCLAPGDTVFMHPLLVHKSDTNNSGKSRKLFINGYSYPGANMAQYPGKGSGEEVELISDDMALNLPITMNY